MDGKIPENRWKNKKIILIFSILIILIVYAIPVLSHESSKTAEKVVYISTKGDGYFNCNGIDDQEKINQALSYVAKNPQYTTVYLKGPNTYVISDSILIGNDTILEGDPTAVIKLKDKAGWKTEKPLITQMESTGNRHIVIKGFEIDGNHNNNSELGRGKGYYNLIYFVNSSNIQVHDMYMHDSHGDGLKVSRSQNIKFYNNRVYKLGHDALYAIYSPKVEAWNNTITCRTNSGLRVYNTNHVSFHNNVINSEGEGGAGIEVQKFNPSTVMDDIEICNNLLNQTNAAGIWITGYGPKEYPSDSAADVYIHHNKFYKTGTNGGFDWSGGVVLNGFQDTLIENNLFDGCYGAAIAHKEVNNEFTAKGTGYTTIVKNNIIINSQPSRLAGKGYAICNKLDRTHSFVLINNCLSNNTGGNYIYSVRAWDSKFDPEFAEQVTKNENLKANFLWNEAMSAGAKRPYKIDGIYAVEKILALRYFEWVI